MPIINGKVVRSRYTMLKLDELSSVDSPAQPGALRVIIKRNSRADEISEIAKYICEDDGATSFVEVLSENKFSQEIWPLTDALSQSIRSIVGDIKLAPMDRDARITGSVNEFLSAVRSISPETEKKLAELTSKRDTPMTKSVAELEGELAKRDDTIKALTTDLAKAKTDFAAMGDAKDKAEADCAEAKKALTEKTDEVITVGGTELRKSVVGEAGFSVAKALRDERDMAQFEKRADGEFGSLVGTTAEKALVLKALADPAVSEEARKAAEAIMTAAEKMTQAGFSRMGSGHGAPVIMTNKAAESAFMDKVSEVQKRDNLTHANALSKARREFPEEFATYNGDTVN